jgi:hypothetical protein
VPPLIGAFAIEYAYCNQGACGQRPETAAYLLDFLLIQITSTLANQYSVLVIHAFSPFVVGSVERKSSRRKRLLIGAAALAVEGISVGSAGCSHGACGQRPEPTGYHLDFLLIQITSAPASQHSVLIIHNFLLSLLSPLSGPKLFKGVCSAAPGAAERV